MLNLQAELNGVTLQDAIIAKMSEYVGQENTEELQSDMFNRCVDVLQQYDQDCVHTFAYADEEVTLYHQGVGITFYLQAKKDGIKEILDAANAEPQEPAKPEESKPEESVPVERLDEFHEKLKLQELLILKRGHIAAQYYALQEYLASDLPPEELEEVIHGIWEDLKLLALNKDPTFSQRDPSVSLKLLQNPIV